jgi:chromosome segregation ATPase
VIDYPELPSELRFTDPRHHPGKAAKAMRDAADVIESLRAELEKEQNYSGIVRSQWEGLRDQLAGAERRRNDDLDAQIQETHRLQAERDVARAELAGAHMRYGGALREAETEDKLRENMRVLLVERDEARAAIERVRELCASHAGDDNVSRVSVPAAIEKELA